MKEKLSHAIYVSADEEISTIVEKTAKAKTARVFLVVPPGALLLQSPINLRILKEEADARSAELIIVTTDLSGAMISEKMGIKCVKSILKDKKENAIIIEREKPRIFIKRKKEAAIAENLEDLEISEDKKSFNFKEKRLFIFRRKNLLIYAFSVAFALIAIIFASIFLPTANVFILAKQASFESEAEANLSLSAKEVSKKEIPCRQIEAKEEFSQEFASTGEKNINDFASGQITIFNEWDSSSHTFPAGSKIVSESGKVFRLQSAATVGGFSRSGGQDVAGKASVKVKAEEPGPDYNIDPEKFFLEDLKGNEKYDKIYGKSDSKISGGRIGKESVVSKEDILSAAKSIEAYAESGDSKVLKTGEGEEIIKESISGKIVGLSFSSKEGDSVGNFNINAIIERKALAISDSILEDFAKNYLGENTVGGKAEIVYFEKNGNGGKVKIKLSGEAAKEISLEKTKELILGKSSADAQKILGSLNLFEGVSVKLWPFWTAKIPNNTEKVNIFLDRNNYFSIIN